MPTSVTCPNCNGYVNMRNNTCACDLDLPDPDPRTDPEVTA